MVRFNSSSISTPNNLTHSAVPTGALILCSNEPHYKHSHLAHGPQPNALANPLARNDGGVITVPDDATPFQRRYTGLEDHFRDQNVHDGGHEGGARDAGCAFRLLGARAQARGGIEPVVTHAWMIAGEVVTDKIGNIL